MQVLGEIFNAIHRADLGGEAEKAADLQLPHKVRLPATAAAAAADGRPAANGGTPLQRERQSLVQRLFGLDVQVSTWKSRCTSADQTSIRVLYVASKLLAETSLSLS